MSFPTRSKQRGPGEKGPGGQDDGEVQLLLEFKVDDIVDWLWEEMKLPNIKARVGPSEESEWIREGYDRRGGPFAPGSAPFVQGDGEAPWQPGRDSHLHRR